MLEFKILKKSKKSKARLGIIKTEHGEIETPCFVPVATQGTIKGLMPHQVIEDTKSQVLICNTYHLMLKPGADIIKKNGQLHSLMNWPKPLMTDSGGFQVFSLGFGRDYGVGKILTDKSQAEVKVGAQPSFLKITEDGVHFRSIVNGDKLFLGPKESIEIQEKIGADIMFTFDECTPPIANYDYTKRSLEKTHRWAKDCLDVKKTNQSLYGIVQGGKYKDLRKESAQFIGSLPFDGFGIGGEFGDSKEMMTSMLRVVLDELPEEKPRHLLGIGKLEDIEKIIKEGVDTFDCIVPTRFARHGVAFTSKGKLDLKKSKFLKENKPLDKDCSCRVCKTYSRSYISHLLKAKEMSGMSLLTIHNLYFFNSYVESLREKIEKGEL
jgi:queuine tRNA-ribosyltransferase